MVVVYTPEGEYHEIGILFANYIFKSDKKKVIYLGQSLPFEDVKFVVENNNPTAIFTAFTSLPSQNDVQFYIKTRTEFSTFENFPNWNAGRWSRFGNWRKFNCCERSRPTDKYSIIKIHRIVYYPKVFVKSIDKFHIFLSYFEIKNIKILLDSKQVTGFGYRRNSF